MKSFYHLLANTVIASITNFTVWFAITFFMFLRTQSVFATSMISGIYLVATALSSIWFGSLVDHHRKKQVMIWSSIGSLVLYAIGAVIYFTTDQSVFSNVGEPKLWVMVIILLAGVIGGGIRNIALPTTVTFLVQKDQRDKANGLVGTANGIGFMITSVISGFLVGRGGLTYVLILALAMTLIAIIHLLLIVVSEKKIVHTTDKPKNIDIKGTIEAVKNVPGLLALILFTTFNNFLGGVFMSLMDAYGLSMVSVEVWGLLFGFLSTAFIIGGMIIAKRGLGPNPVRSLFMANVIIWSICCVFTIYPSIVPLVIGMFVYLAVVPFIEASENTIVQKVISPERQGRVFGFAHSVEQAASPLTAFAIGPLTQFLVIPFMTTGAGVDLIGPWFGTGPTRAIALVFTVTGIIGLCITLLAMHSKQAKALAERYQQA